jgi:hypothetical protein
MSEKDDTVESLVNQLKDASALTNNVTKVGTQFNLPKEELEQFVINNAAQLIVECLDTIQEYKELISAAPNPEDVSAYSDLMSASTKALESLNKILVQDKRSDTTLKIKNLELDQKKELIEHKAKTEAFTSTREELLKKLLDDAKVVRYVDVTEDATSEDFRKSLTVGVSSSP